MRIVPNPLPIGSFISNALPRIDYSDAYSCRFTAKQAVKIEDLARAFFGASPKWVGWLFRLRNTLVRFMGLKTPTGRPPKEFQDSDFEKGKTLGLFKIFEKNEKEILSGENDSHLDFRVSFFLETLADPIPFRYHFYLSTAVMFHGFFGKLYFLPVKPFHKLIVKAMMRKMIATMSA